MTEEERKALALAAAHAAAEAATELMRYAREGPNWPTPFGNEEPIEKLADATKMTLELLAAAPDCRLDDEQGQLLGACSNYVDGWMG